MPFGNFYFGKNGFFYKKMGGAGGRKNPVLGCNGTVNLNNRYIAGAGVGATNVANRRARLQRSSTCSPYCKV